MATSVIICFPAIFNSFVPYLILVIGTHFVPWLWVVLPVPADLWIEQCQTHHIQCCSSAPCSNKDEERNQLEPNEQKRVVIITHIA